MANVEFTMAHDSIRFIRNISKFHLYYSETRLS